MLFSLDRDRGTSFRAVLCWPYIAIAAIPAAYMMSVHVYKIWYITTALCGTAVAAAFFLDKDRWLIARNFFHDGTGVFVYVTGMLAAGLLSYSTQSGYCLLVDSIYPVVFAIFYYVGLKSSAEDIINAMRLLVWAAVIAMAAFWDESAIRQGYRVIEILPFAAPFMVLALYQGSRLAGLELGATIVLLTVTMSRTPLAVATIGTVASLILLARSTRNFALTTAQAAIWIAVLFVGANNLSFINAKMNNAGVRISGTPISSFAPIPFLTTSKSIVSDQLSDQIARDLDSERTAINQLYWKLLPSAGGFGLGYGNFIKYFEVEYPDQPAMSLHNVYQVWTLETGLIGALSAVVMVGLFYLTMFRGYVHVQSFNVEQRRFLLTISISMLAVLAAAVFHQMHQAPMFYALMGTGLGACRKSRELVDEKSTDLTRRDTHFEFGANWAEFANTVDNKRIDMAVDSLRKLLPDLAGKSFIDIGSGSGLSSLAALHLGASRVYAVDIDENSVATTQALLAKHAPDAPWSAEKVSVFDLSPDQHGTFDVVHSWGVLHHTGAMWRAIEVAAALVKPDGDYAIAIYNSTTLDPMWKVEKRYYTRAPGQIQWLARQGYMSAVVMAKLLRGRNPVAFFRDYFKVRGMSFTHDVHDWLGGYPYESSSVEEMRRRFAALGFRETRSFVWPKSMGLFGSSCNEFVFSKVKKGHNPS